MDNVFTQKTKQGLQLSKENILLLAPRGFDFFDDDDNNQEEERILIMGLNPAGDENDIIIEKTCNIFFYGFDGCPSSNRNSKKLWYQSYFNPIHSFVEETLGKGKVKWSWCNKSWSSIEKEIANFNKVFENKIITTEEINKIKEYYFSHKSNKYSIYIGDMFYYHVTNSKDLPFKKNFDYSEYCKEMLKMHINKLKENNKTIKYVYINNAKVSGWLSDKEGQTSKPIDNIPVFFGGMLSGQHSMDNFSKLRAIKEIRDYLE